MVPFNNMREGKGFEFHGNMNRSGKLVGTGENSTHGVGWKCVPRGKAM